MAQAPVIARRGAAGNFSDRPARVTTRRGRLTLVSTARNPRSRGHGGHRAGSSPADDRRKVSRSWSAGAPSPTDSGRGLLAGSRRPYGAARHAIREAPWIPPARRYTRPSAFHGWPARRRAARAY